MQKLGKSRVNWNQLVILAGVGVGVSKLYFQSAPTLWFIGCGEEDLSPISPGLGWEMLLEPPTVIFLPHLSGWRWGNPLGNVRPV